MGVNKYDALLGCMTACAVLTAPPLRYALGDKFEQNYPAAGDHKDNRVFLYPEVEEAWRLWQRTTLVWRQAAEKFRSGVGGDYTGGGNGAA